jgi:hypothetical protein
VVRAIRDKDDVRRFRRVIAPGQTWVRWDELAAHQAEVLRGLVDAEWQRVESGLKSPEGRRARIRLIPRPEGGEKLPT